MKKHTAYFIIFSFLLALLIGTLYILLLFVFDLKNNEKIAIATLMTIISIALEVNLFIPYYVIKRRREDIKHSFDYYIENQISHSGIGVIIFNDDLEIIWATKFIENRFGETIIGKKMSDISDQLSSSIEQGNKNFRIPINDFIFEVIVNNDKKNIVLKDVTNEDIALKQYNSEKLVIGELEIDNFQELQTNFPQEEMFKINKAITNLFDVLSEKYNFIYKQYINGKYLFFTNEIALTDLQKNNFDILDEVRKTKLSDYNNLTISIGVARGTSDQKTLYVLAKDGLTQAKARGGDQVALMSMNEKPAYFGSKFEISQISSRIKIKQIANLFEERISDKEISNVIIYGHKIADLDAVGAAFAVEAIARSYNKKVFVGNVTFDKTADDVLKEQLSKEELSIFIKPNKANKLTTRNSLIVIVDTADMSRIENDQALKGTNLNNVFIFDHHRVTKFSDEIPKNNIYIDTLASSTSEILSEAISFMKRKIKLSKKTAQFLLNGIYLDTASFTKAISSRTYQAASFLENQGASSNISSNIMKYPEEAFLYIQEILNNLQEIKPGYFLATYEGEVPTDVVSMAADEILRTRGRKAAFVVAKSKNERNAFKMSARGVDTNVQKIAERVGGGGHFAAAAANSKEPLPVFVDNIRQAIIDEKGEK